MIFATGLHSCKKKFWILIQHFYFYSFLTYSEHIRKCSKLQIMMVFPVLIPVQNFLFPGTGRENLKCHGKGRDGKFEACIPGNHGKREFPLTPAKLGTRKMALPVQVRKIRDHFYKANYPQKWGLWPLISFLATFTCVFGRFSFFGTFGSNFRR